MSESGVSPAAFSTVTHLIQRTCRDKDDDEEGLTFTVSRGYPTATPKAPEHTDQNTVTCNITEKLWILSCFRRLELLVKQSHIHIRTSDRTGDEIREVHHDQNQQNRSQRNRIRSEPTDESEPAEPITEEPDQQMNQNQQNRSQRNRNRSEPTDESEQAEPITEEPEPNQQKLSEPIKQIN